MLCCRLFSCRLLFQKKGRGRKSTGDIGGRAAAEDDKDGEEFLFGGGPGGGGGAAAENGLLEAVRRNDTALSAVVADWVRPTKIHIWVDRLFR